MPATPPISPPSSTIPPILLASAEVIGTGDLTIGAPVAAAPEPRDRDAFMLLGGLVLALAIARRRRAWIVLPIEAGPRTPPLGAERAHGPNGLSAPHGHVLPER